MSSGFSQLDRPPLSQRSLTVGLVRPGALWTSVRVVDRTASTNADVAAAARRGEPAGLVLVAELQDAGRGRLDRQWVSPARAGLTFSVLLRPGAVETAAAADRRGWLPLVAGLAVARAVRAYTGLDAVLKWPNDVLVSGRKLAGVLAEVVGEAVVVGVGINVTTRSDELPAGVDATSLLLAGAPETDRDPLLRLVLRELAALYGDWELGADLARRYLDLCDTVGWRIRVAFPDGTVIETSALDVDQGGRLLLADGRAVAAGDVTHVRPV